MSLTRDELRTKDNHISNMSCFLHTLSAEGSDTVDIYLGTEAVGSQHAETKAQ